MAGLSSLLNVAKQGLLTHQMNLHITGNNITNVATKSYSRQNTILAPTDPTPSGIGPIGNGVTALEVNRDFDKFITTTLFDKTSTMGGLDARQAGMKMVETIMNEVDTNALSGTIDRFWAAWEDLANNAEGIAERQNLLEQASLIVTGLRERYNSLLKLSEDVNLNIQQSINDINKLASQISDLNVQIVSLEAGGHSANDLRDQRDELVKNLSSITDINFFETKRGSYTILIGQGSPLVENDQSWELEMREDSVFWIGSAGQTKELTTEDIQRGELGGWMEIKSLIHPKDPQILTGSVMNTSRGLSINTNTRWEDIDGVTVAAGFSIQFSGTDQDGKPVNSTFTYDPGPPETNATVGDFLENIEEAYRLPGPPPIDRVQARINDEGRIIIEDVLTGDFPISFHVEGISGGVYDLNLGNFDSAYPLNYLEELNKIGTEFIKTVNSQHSQGVGLAPLQETAAVFSVINQGEPISMRSSGLVMSDEITNGSFEIWLYDSDGNVIDYDPSTPEVNDPFVVNVLANSTTITDIRDAISNAAFPVSGSHVGLSARILDGRLVIQTDGSTTVSGFAFGKDTSGALTGLGLNSFFTGYDAATIGLNQVLEDDPRLIAAAQVGPRGSSYLASSEAVKDSSRPLGLEISAGKFTLWVQNEAGHLVDMIDDMAGVNPIEITIDNPTTQSIEDIVAKINEVEGISADIDKGQLRVWVDDDMRSEDPLAPDSPGKWTSVTLGNDSSNFLKYLGLNPGHFSSETGTLETRTPVTDPAAVLTSAQSGLKTADTIDSGSFTINRFATDGTVVGSSTIEIDKYSTSLQGLADAIDNTVGLDATIETVTIQGIEYHRLSITSTNPGELITFSNDTSGVLSAIGIGQQEMMATGNFLTDRLTEPMANLATGITDGTFNLYLYDDNGNALATSLTGSEQMQTSAATPITAATVWNDIQGFSISGAGPHSFNITFAGADIDGSDVFHTYTVNDPATDTVQGFLNAINAAYPSGSVTASIDPTGRLTLVSNAPDKAISFSINEIKPVSVLDTMTHVNFGTFNGNFPFEVNSAYDSLDDIAKRLDSMEDVRAWVQDGRLNISTEARGGTFVLADDTTGPGVLDGLLQGLGLLTPAGGEVSPANNLNALKMGQASREQIDALDGARLGEAYYGLIGSVGIQSRAYQMDYDFSQNVVNELQKRRDEVSGVSLDEEMADLIKFQHSFAAASKLISAADEMFQTLLQAK